MINTIDLNLASRPIRNNTLPWVGQGMLALIVVGASVWNLTSYVTNRRELTGLKAERDSFQGRMDDLDRRESAARQGIARFDVKELDVRASKASDVIRRKALSWTRLFNRMEEVLPYEVRMVSIRPVFDSERRSAADRSKVPVGAIPVSVEGIARTLNAFLELERALIFDPHFDGVEPHRYDRTESGEVRFDLRFLYFPDPPEEETLEAEEPAVATVAPEGATDEPGEGGATDDPGDDDAQPADSPEDSS